MPRSPLPAPQIIRLTMPEPPSANRYWRMGRSGQGGKRSHMILSSEARNYKAAGRLAYAQATGTLKVAFVDGEIAVTLRWFRGRKSGDLDNRIKQVLDSLAGCAYTNDSQITELHCFRYDDAKNARMEVTLSRPLP